MSQEWYYASEQAGKQSGPVSMAELSELKREGIVARDCLVWREGMDTWTTAGNLIELFPAPPPLPVSFPKRLESEKSEQGTHSSPPPLPATLQSTSQPPPFPTKRKDFPGPDHNSRFLAEDSLPETSPPSHSTTEGWYYNSNGTTVGPLDRNAMAALVSAGVVLASTSVWTRGMPAWLPATQTELISRQTYAAPPPLPSATGSAPTEIEKRDVLLVGVLSAITFGLYAFYLIYEWCKDINARLGREKFPPVLALVLSIITLGFAGMLFECGIALELEKLTKRLGIKDRVTNLGITVIILNVISWILAFGTGGALIPVSLIMGVVATCMIQTEMNKLVPQQCL